MSQTPTSGKVLIAFWCSPTLAAKLRAKAARQERSLSALVRLVLQREIE